MERNLTGLDPDGCLVRNREWLRNHKKNEKTGAQTQAGGIIMGAQCNKVGAVATGEVFFLDIGLLMGAI